MLLCSSVEDRTAQSLSKVKFSVHLPRQLLLPPPPEVVLEREEGENVQRQWVKEQGNYAYSSFSLKSRWRKAKQISHKERVCAVVMTTKCKGQMLSFEELPSTSRNQIADVGVCMTLACGQLHPNFEKEGFCVTGTSVPDVSPRAIHQCI